MEERRSQLFMYTSNEMKQQNERKICTRQLSTLFCFSKSKRTRCKLVFPRENGVVRVITKDTLSSWHFKRFVAVRQ
jgi:hypothetical protein